MIKYAMLAVVVAAELVFPTLSHAEVSVDDRLAPGQPAIVIAHRAVGGGAPENSLAGIQHAIERGIDMVEIDVQITHEGNYVLMHDTSLTRTTNVQEVFPEGAPSREPGDPHAFRHLVSDYTLDNIARLRLIDLNGGDHRVPSLDAALDVAGGQLLVMLDLKRWEVDGIASLLERHDSENILLFSFRDQGKLAATADATGVGVFTTFFGLPDFEQGFENALDRYGPRLRMVDVSPSNFSPELLERGRELGVRIGIDGMSFQDQRLRAGSTAPWMETFETGAEAYWTQLPDEVMELLGR